MADPTKPVRQLAESAFQPAEYQRDIWIVRPEPGTTVEEILSTTYWVHNTRRLRVDSEIIVRDPEGKYRLHLLVRAKGEGWARVVVLQKWEFEKKEAADVPMPESTEYRTEFAGAAKWRVIRLADNKVMKDGLTKLEAARWLTDHLAELARA